MPARPEMTSNSASFGTWPSSMRAYAWSILRCVKAVTDLLSLESARLYLSNPSVVAVWSANATAGAPR
jgi:hypothetical protein